MSIIFSYFRGVSDYMEEKKKILATFGGELIGEKKGSLG